MSLLINDFKRGWQNKARHELMHDDAVYVATDVDFSETGSIKPRKSISEDTEWPFWPFTNDVALSNMYKIYVEGVDKYLFYITDISSGLNRYNSVTKASATISTSIKYPKQVSYAPCRPILSSYTYVYITDGTTMLCDNGTSTKTWGIDPPEGAPTIEIGTLGGSLSAGDYSYVYTFYDNATGSESDASPACASLTVGANASILVSNIQTSSNSRVTSRRLYRTIANGGSHYLVAIIPDNVVREYEDTITDQNLTQAVSTDQGVPPTCSIVGALKNVLFLTGNVNYPNRVYYCPADKPDNWPSTYYLEVGPSGTVVQNMAVVEGKMYFVTKTGVAGLYGYEDQPDTYAIQETKATVGTYAKWSPAVAGNLYYLAKEGIMSFDGIRNERVSRDIDRLFGDTPKDLYPVVDRDQAITTAKGVGFNGKYYIKLPLKYASGTTYNKLLEYDPTEKQWRLIGTTIANGAGDKQPIYDIHGDDNSGTLYAVTTSYKFSYLHKQVFKLLSTDTLHAGDSIDVEVVTKNYDFTAAPDNGVKASDKYYLTKETRTSDVASLIEFRIDCRGTWTFYFYIDEVLRHTETLTGQTQADAYQWHKFPSKIKGRFVYVKAIATDAAPTTHILKEIEVR